MNISKREHEKAIEDTKRVAEEPKSIKDKHDATQTLQQVGNISASARIGNDILFGNIEALGDNFERAQRHTKEFTRINANTTKAIENTARETSAEFSVNSQRSLYSSHQLMTR